MLDSELDTSWKDDGACVGSGIDFFSDDGISWRDAVAVCATCPVKHPCLDYALETNQGFGVWGGETVRGRRRILKARKLARAAAGE
jgi:WhiB family redox-sensing transcriptional regulator